MKIDKTDLRILKSLDYNARIPLSGLANKLKISKQVLNYRIKKLFENKVIKSAVSVIDIHKLGYLTYRVYARLSDLKEETEKKVINYFKKHKNVLWFVTLNGNWDIELVFVARNFIHFGNMWKKVKEDIGSKISKYNLSMSIVNYHFPRDYLIEKNRKSFKTSYYGFEPKKEKIDELDMKILSELSKNCRKNNFEIGEKLGVTYHTIKNRISRMENLEIIQSHRIDLDLSKINRFYYKILVYLRRPKKEDEKKLWDFCSKYNFLTYIVEVLGDWQFEFELEPENEKQFLDFLRDFKNEFSNLIEDYEILFNIKEHKLNYFPIGKI